MYVPFESLPDASRIWIYQSNRKFNLQEMSAISDALLAFSQQWNAHGIPLRSSFEIPFGQFIIVAVDEDSNAASGCSIDDSVRMIKALDEKLGVELFDRTKIAFKLDSGIITIPLDQLKGKYLEGLWNNQTLVVNNLISSKGELAGGWLVAAEQTWIRRYLPGKAVIS
jgi:hypothetical protein